MQDSDSTHSDTLARRVINEIPVGGPNFRILIMLAYRHDMDPDEPFTLERWALYAHIPMPAFLRRLERLLASKRLTCVDGVYHINLPEAGRA